MSTMPGALPWTQQILIDLLFPPVGAGIWWLIATVWAMVFQGGKISERTKAVRKRLFWVLLAAAYALMFGVTLYAYLT